MKIIVIGDFNTLIGVSEKPSKVEYLINNGIDVKGVQIISTDLDLLPVNLENYHLKLLELVKKFPHLERVSVAILCWPKVKLVEDGNTLDVAAHTLLSDDLYYYALGICRALQKLHDKTGISVDISYHTNLLWPSSDLSNVNTKSLQKFLRQLEQTRRKEFIKLLKMFDIKDVGVSIENEPTVSNTTGSQTHSNYRLWSEVLSDQPKGWGLTADIQHLAMILKCLENPKEYKLIFPVTKKNSDPEYTWEGQFKLLQKLSGPITFHISQMDHPLKHVSPPIRFDDPIMQWKKILRLIKELEDVKEDLVWYAVEIDGGHVYPAGYENDLKAFKCLTFDL